MWSLQFAKFWSLYDSENGYAQNALIVMLMLLQVLFYMKWGLQDTPWKQGQRAEQWLCSHEALLWVATSVVGSNGTSHSSPLGNLTTPSFCPQNVTYHWAKSACLLSHLSSFSSSKTVICHSTGVIYAVWSHLPRYIAGLPAAEANLRTTQLNTIPFLWEMNTPTFLCMCKLYSVLQSVAVISVANFCICKSM